MQLTTTSAFLEYFESIRGRTRRVVTCIPPDRIEWTHAGYDGVLDYFDRMTSEEVRDRSVL